jgi:hypothetical protein
VNEEKAKVTCRDCSFEWFGHTAAHALRTIGSCTRCRGELSFADEPVLPALLEPVVDVPPHLALGNPRF